MRTTKPAWGWLMVLVLGPAATEATEAMPECTFALFDGKAETAERRPPLDESSLALYLAPGESKTAELDFALYTDQYTDQLPALGDFHWQITGAGLGSPSPESGRVQQLSVSPPEFAGRVRFDFTAGQQPGSELVLLSIRSPDANAHESCRVAEVAIPVTVGRRAAEADRTETGDRTAEGGKWSFTSTYRSRGMMPLTQSQTGTFTIVDGGRIEGEGQNHITVTGTCSFLEDKSAFRIGGSIEDGMIRLVLDHDEGDVADVQLHNESPGCVVRSAVESLTLVGAVMSTIAKGVSCGALGFQVDDPKPWECDGISAEVRRVAGN